MMTVQSLPIDNLQQQARAGLDAARQKWNGLQLRAQREAIRRGHDAREWAAGVCDDPLARWTDALVARGAPSQLRTRLDDAKAFLQRMPIEDVDGQTAKALAVTVGEMPLWQVEAVRRHELANKGRVTVLRACEARLGA